MPTAELVKRLSLSLLAGVFLLASLITPAQAIIPVAGVVGGVVVRGVTGSLLRKAGVSGVGNAASALSAQGLFGVSAAAYIVICGQNALAGNDCSGTPLAKLRPQGVSTNEGESNAASVPATAEANAGWCSHVYGCTWGVASSPQAACQLVAPNFGGGNPGSCSCTSGCSDPAAQVWGFNWAGGRYDLWYYKNGTLYTCPAGYTRTGTSPNYTCVPPVGNWAPDGVASYRNSGGVWVGDPADPDTAPPLANPYVADAVQPDGQPMKVKVEALSDGSIKVTTYGQGSASGQTTTTVNEIRVSSTGTPTAVTNIFYGDVSTVYNNSSSPTTNTPAPAPVEIPSDYQRDSTGQQTNTKLQTIITDGVKVKEENMPSATDAYKGVDTTATVDALKGVATTASAADGKDTGWKISWTPPTSCTNPSPFTLPRGVVLNADLCQHQSSIHGVMSFLWVLLTVGSCLSMIRGTMTGSA